MKSVIIYCMPRTKSTAAMQACKRSNKIFEPFNPFRLFGVDYSEYKDDVPKMNRLYARKALEINSLYPSYAKSIASGVIEKTITQLNDPDTVSKITCLELTKNLTARKWFENAATADNHEIFVLVRDLREQIFSYLLASKFGYFKDSECEPYEVVIPPGDFLAIIEVIDNFLRFVPKNAYLINFDTMPTQYFDIDNITILPQNSIDKLKFVKNLDYCEYHIKNIIDYYSEYWNQKIGTLKTF